MIDHESHQKYHSAIRLQRADRNQNCGRAARANKKRHGVKEPQMNYKAPYTYMDIMMSHKECRNKKKSHKQKDSQCQKQ